MVIGVIIEVPCSFAYLIFRPITMDTDIYIATDEPIYFSPFPTGEEVGGFYRAEGSVFQPNFLLARVLI